MIQYKQKISENDSGWLYLNGVDVLFETFVFLLALKKCVKMILVEISLNNILVLCQSIWRDAIVNHLRHLSLSNTV